MALLLRELAHDADAAQRLLQVGGDVRDLDPGQPVDPHRRDPEDDTGNDQQREGQERDQRQRCIEEQHDHDHSDQRQQARDKSHNSIGHQRVQRLDIIRQARDQHSRSAAGKEADRLRLNVCVNALPKILKRSLSDPTDEVGLGVTGRPKNERGDDEGGDDHGECAGVIGANTVVDRAPGQVRGRQRSSSCDEQHHAGQDHP